MSAWENLNGPGVPLGWRGLAWQVQHHPAFLGYLLRDLDESGIALRLGVERVTIWQIKVCLLLRGVAVLQAVEAYFGLTGGCLGTLLSEPGRSHHGSGVSPQVMMTGGTS